MAFRPRISSLGVALALGAGWLWPLAAEAARVAITPVAEFNDSASVTDAEGGGATIGTNVSLGSSAVARFNPTLGVLTGATLNLTSARTQTVSATATAGRGTDSNSDSVATSGWGKSTAKITAPGVDTSFAVITATDSCEGKPKHECTGTPTSSAPATTNLAAVVPDSSLDGYVGTGKVAVAREAPTLAAEQLTSVFTGTETTTSTVTWAGRLSATYEYLLHALPSFSADSQELTLSLDFGMLALNEEATPRLFDISNIVGADGVGLDLDGISGSGALGPFLLTGLRPFAGLEAGGSYGYSVDFHTSAAGIFSATYLLALSDADVGAASSRFDYLLTLNLSGTVVDNPQREVRNSVPEPGSLALLLGGLAGVIATRRRRLPA